MLGLGLLAGAVGSAVRDDGPPMPWAAFRALCEHWAAVWGLPAVVLLVVGEIESSRRPGMSNTRGDRAQKRGGSWGLFGMTTATAADLLAKHEALRTQPAAAAWTGRGDSLHDPQLAAMLASFYLATLWHMFQGAVLPTVAAYQQGPKTVAHVLATGGNLATDLPHYGREYVANAQRALAALTSRGAA